MDLFADSTPSLTLIWTLFTGMPERKAKMTTRDQFVRNVLRIAQQQGFKIESSKRIGQLQIDFGNKKLHATHLAQLFEAAMDTSQDISRAIEKIAPGRPCTHKPMREIIKQFRAELNS